ncbi:MAG TPA: class I SAM-dependent methyltransferase [Candidatus Baltobacteraceae bacterium]|jgi:ubiquinone/menaquinone biosynthesis C-methylase UbiE|nr:class I SAM-dependent methyltransferase [Candidatus Baltobacteraceae bacterium]
MSENTQQPKADMFIGTAGYYAKYRPGYPPELFQEIVQFYRLDGTGVMLDLGAGTGQLSIPLARYFESIIAMDPDPEMLAEGKKAALKSGVHNITWRDGSSENIADLHAKLKLVTMGRSFHWMNCDRVLSDLYAIIEPEGGIVIAADSEASRVPSNFSVVRKAVIEKFLGKRRRAGSGYYEVSEEPFEAIVGRSNFTLAKISTTTMTQHWTIDSIVGHTYSTSFASPAVLGDKLPDFERELRAELQKLSPSGDFIEEIETKALLLKRAPQRHKKWNQ